jgi:hypothetical protein
MSVEAVSRGVVGFEVGLRCLLAAIDRGDAASIAGWFEMGHFADWRAAGLAVPAVLQLDDPVAGGGAGDQVESVGLGEAVEQPGALARNVGEQAQLELVDQVEPHERPPEADAAPDHDVAVAAPPELVDLAHSAVLRVREKTTLRPAFRMSAKGWSVAVVMDPAMPS